MKRINNISIICITIISLFYLLVNYETLTTSKIITILCVLPALLVIRIVNKLFKLNISDNLEFIYIIYLFFAFFLGSVVGFYHTINYYDKVMHFISGVITSLIAVTFIKNFKIKNITFSLLFIVIFSSAVAGVWEILEFTIDKILNIDCQNVLTTGVDDSMTDMIMAISASILYTLIRGKRALKR